MSNHDKRRRVESGNKNVSRKEQQAAVNLGTLNQEEGAARVESLKFHLSSLPLDAIERYLAKNGLADPAQLLSYPHAVFPVPPLPRDVVSALDDRSYITDASLLQPVIAPEDYVTIGQVEMATTSRNFDTKSRRTSAYNSRRRVQKTGKRGWRPSKLPEIADLTSFDSDADVRRKFAARAQNHFDRAAVKETDVISQFIVAVKAKNDALKL